MYTILAWLPGTSSFIAKDSYGVIGNLTPAGFSPGSPSLFHAATEKHHYVRVDETPLAKPSEAAELAMKLKQAQA